MSLFLDEKEVLGHGLNISVQFNLASKDISGDSSRSETAATGDKPKAMSLRLDIPFKEAENLTALVTLAETRNEQGQRKVFNILNATAEAMNIRRVRFDGSLRVREDFSKELWRVSFKLGEVLTVAELTAAGAAANNPQSEEEQAAAGESVAPVVSAPDFTDFEKVLSFIEKIITPDAEPVADATE